MQVWANVQASRRKDGCANARATDRMNEWTNRPTYKRTWASHIGIRSTGFCSVCVCRTPSASAQVNHTVMQSRVWRHFLYTSFYPCENSFDSDQTARHQIDILLKKLRYTIWEFIEWKTDRCFASVAAVFAVVQHCLLVAMVVLLLLLLLSLSDMTNRSVARRISAVCVCWQKRVKLNWTTAILLI